MKIQVKIEKQAILLMVVVIAAFAAGWGGKTLWQQNSAKKIDLHGKTVKIFKAQKRNRPQVDVFVMSFCPYGNQMEDNLSPVVQLLGDKVAWQPHYIVSKLNAKQVCQRQVYQPKLCQEYVQRHYFPDVKSCRQRLYPNLNACLKKILPQLFLVDSENGYTSLHGRQELNEDIREVCAWQQKKNVQQWWRFVEEVNKKCSSRNADNCWSAAAKAAGFSPEKIQACFNHDAKKILAQELAKSQAKQVTGSPTVFINDQLFPPKGAYAKDAVLKIGKQVYSINQYRDPETLKTAICSAFKHPPRACRQKLKTSQKANPPKGSCGS